MKTFLLALTGLALLADSASALTGPSSIELTTTNPDGLWVSAQSSLALWRPARLSPGFPASFNGYAQDNATNLGLVFTEDGIPGVTAIEIQNLPARQWAGLTAPPESLIFGVGEPTSPDLLLYDLSFAGVLPTITSGVRVTAPNGETLQEFSGRIEAGSIFQPLGLIGWVENGTGRSIVAEFDLENRTTNWAASFVSGFFPESWGLFGIPDGRVFLTDQLIGPNVRIIVLNNDGTLRWARQYTGENSQSIVLPGINADGSLFLLESNFDEFTLRSKLTLIDENGNRAWTREFSLGGTPVAVQPTFFGQELTLYFATTGFDPATARVGMVRLSASDGSTVPGTEILGLPNVDGLTTARQDVTDNRIFLFGQELGSGKSVLVLTDLNGVPTNAMRLELTGLLPNIINTATFNTYRDESGDGLRSAFVTETPGGVTIWENSSSFTPGGAGDCGLWQPIPITANSVTLTSATASTQPGWTAFNPDVQTSTATLNVTSLGTLPPVTPLTAVPGTECYLPSVMVTSNLLTGRLVTLTPQPVFEITFFAEANAFYEVKRTTDFQTFETIDFIAGTGASVTRQYTDLGVETKQRFFYTVEVFEVPFP